MITLGPTIRRARKAHACALCDVSIRPGHRYERSALLVEGTAYTLRLHVCCAALLERVGDDLAFDPMDLTSRLAEWLTETSWEAVRRALPRVAAADLAPLEEAFEQANVEEEVCDCYPPARKLCQHHAGAWS